MQTRNSRRARREEQQTESEPESPLQQASDQSDSDDPEYIYEDAWGDEDFDEEEGGSSDSDAQGTLLGIFRNAARSAFSSQVAHLPRIEEYTPPVLEHELATELRMRTAALSPRCILPTSLQPTGQLRGSSGRSSGIPWRPRTSQRRRDSALESEEQQQQQQQQQREGEVVQQRGVMNPARALLLREGKLGSLGGQFDAAQCAHFGAFHRLPTRHARVADFMHSRGYIGQFNATGDVFVAAYQDERKVKMYDVHNSFQVLKDVHARNLRWTVTDTCLSSDQKFLLYSSITSTVHLVNVERGQGSGSTESIANVTDIHEGLHFSAEGDGEHYSTGIWSIRWSHDNKEIIAGTADQSLYIYDMMEGKTVMRVEGHSDDVNAVAYAEPDSSNIIFTGADDHLIKVWDRRLLRGRRSKPVGVFIGHTEGITHLDAKGDGRFLISNSKDQTIKLWDTRAMRKPAEAKRVMHTTRPPSFSWDYRWMEYPAAGRVVTHPADGALQTYRGHSVLSTLIRAYWSPAATTGQRYIYSGSHDGTVYMWNVITGQIVRRLRHHQEPVRDCSWHPTMPLLATVSFDGTLCTFEPEVPGDAEAYADEVAATGRDPKKSTAGRRAAADPLNHRRGRWALDEW